MRRNSKQSRTYCPSAKLCWVLTYFVCTEVAFLQQKIEIEDRSRCGTRGETRLRVRRRPDGKEMSFRSGTDELGFGGIGGALMVCNERTGRSGRRKEILRDCWVVQGRRKWKSFWRYGGFSLAEHESPKTQWTHQDVNWGGDHSTPPTPRSWQPLPS